jgi:hypothetical protein
MKESESRAHDPSRCEALNARGERCGKRAARGRFCLVHAGAQDMRELGRKGGSRSPLTRLRREAGQDDGLRELARETLAKALRGEQVEKAQLDAARSLFAFRPQVPPHEGTAHESEGKPGKGIYLGDLIRCAIETGILTGENLRLAGEPVAVDSAARRLTPSPREESASLLAPGCPESPRGSYASTALVSPSAVQPRAT